MHVVVKKKKKKSIRKYTSIDSNTLYPFNMGTGEKKEAHFQVFFHIRVGLFGFLFSNRQGQSQ